MRILKRKWRFYSIIDDKGTELAVASTIREAKKLVKKIEHEDLKRRENYWRGIYYVDIR